MIPKRVFLFWGLSPMSWLRSLTVRSLCRHNPDHEIVLCTPKATYDKNQWCSNQRQDFSHYTGPDYSETLHADNLIRRTVEVEHANAMHQSDFFKWRMLASEGGWFSDMDILYLKPLPQIDAGAVLSFDRFWSMGLIASQGASRLFADILRYCIEMYDPRQYDSTNQKPCTEVAPSFKALQERYPECRPHNLPMVAVYPFGHKQADRYWEPARVPEGCIGLHWYAGTKAGHRGNMTLGPDSQSDGMIQNAAREYR